MSTGLPQRIRVLPGQSGERQYSGSLPLAALPRLAASIAGKELQVQVELTLSRDRRGQRLAQTGIQVVLPLQCQRCLGSFEWSASLDAALLVVDGDKQSVTADDADTVTLQDGTLDLAALVEDEILLALPIVPLHADDSDCGRQHKEGSAPLQETAEDHPFAALAALKTKH